MSPDKSLQILFNAALERSDAAERARFLDEACGADAALRERVEKLLRAQEEVGAFMAQPSRKPAGLDLHQTGRVVIPLTEKPGDLIGRYKLLQQIGEGGCGVVYMAEQEEPVRRRVALKVIKLGMDTKQVIARFEAERQALALMDHPHIARVLDAGATDTGRPYFVMELVRGTKITEFCDENNLSTEERLKLFMEVCQAIQHAHQKGIIHRDIKPSNILVTINDGVPVPKVIDFGIAKATAGRLTNQTLFTAFEQFIGTPAYMSPEQAVMTSLDIDTRSDIYSLGVLLYELLTGSPPFDQKELLAAGLDEMRRTIREVEPAKPSTRLTQELVAADVSPLKSHPESGRNVRADSRRLLQEVKGDLDWIAMKCLEKDRSRRYETANALAMDIRRHLENEPVVARPPSRWYEFQKTVRRHKFGFAAATALILVLMLGVAISTWQAARATKAENLANNRLAEVAAERDAKEQALQEAEAARANEARLRRQIEVRLTIAQARTLLNNGKFDETETLLNGIEPSLIEPDAIHADLRRQLANHRASKNQWSAATANLAVLLQVDGTAWDTQVANDYYFYATAIMEAGDKAGYERFRQALVIGSIGTQEWRGAEFVCLISLLAPAEKQFMADLGSRYDTASKSQEFTGSQAQAEMSANYLNRAIVDFRRGNYSKADELIQHCGPRQAKPYHMPLVLTIRAMIHHQLHRDEEARMELASARLAIDPIMRGGPGPKITGYFGWFAADIFLREATALIEGPTNAPAVNVNSQAN
jgi:eukaryotic-like serine/threonine-protein kinase